MNTPKERPILFSAPMVRAILDGTKTQTRRLNGFAEINRNPDDYRFLKVCDLQGEAHAYFHQISTGDQILVRCPYGQPGDRLWVKETSMLFSNPAGVGYRADTDNCGQVPIKTMDNHRIWRTPHGKWTPSIFMRREFSRITLEIVSIRVERLQEIALGDICKEGLAKSIYDFKPAQDGLRQWQELWESINGLGSWAANPWVWVVEFKRVQP